MFNHYYVWKDYNGQEVVIQDGLTYDQAQAIVDRAAHYIASTNGVTFEQAKELTGLNINSYN